MLKDSVVTRTGQLWKLLLAVLLMLVGSFAPLWPATGLDWLSGSLVAVAGFAGGALLIRCPGCGQRWFWAALTRPEEYGPLFGKPDCPACKRSF
ncbi:MAG: hypothetical protein JJT85_08030 [Chromatiales bacterium]|nr:hypothetical protein [Chromatiales bacterium]